MQPVEYDENELAEAARMHDLAHGAYIDLWREGGLLVQVTAQAA